MAAVAIAMAVLIRLASHSIDRLKPCHGDVDLVRRMQTVVTTVDSQQWPGRQQSGNVPELAECQQAGYRVAGTVPQRAMGAQVVVVGTARHGDVDTLVAGRRVQCCHAAARIAHQQCRTAYLRQRQGPVQNALQIPHALTQGRATDDGNLPVVAGAMATPMALTNVGDAEAVRVAAHATRCRRNGHKAVCHRLHSHILVLARWRLPGHKVGCRVGATGPRAFGFGVKTLSEGAYSVGMEWGVSGAQWLLRDVAVRLITITAASWGY